METISWPEALIYITLIIGVFGFLTLLVWFTTRNDHGTVNVDTIRPYFMDFTPGQTIKSDDFNNRWETRTETHIPITEEERKRILDSLTSPPTIKQREHTEEERKDLLKKMTTLKYDGNQPTQKVTGPPPPKTPSKVEQNRRVDADAGENTTSQG